MELQSLPSVSPDSKLKALVLDTLTSPESRRAYDRAIDQFLTWLATQPTPLFSKSTIQAYKTALLSSGSASSSINIKLCAIRRLAAEASDNSLLDSEVVGAISRVKGVKLLRKKPRPLL